MYKNDGLQSKCLDTVELLIAKSIYLLIVLLYIHNSYFNLAYSRYIHASNRHTHMKLPCTSWHAQKAQYQ